MKKYNLTDAQFDFIWNTIPFILFEKYENIGMVKTYGTHTVILSPNWLTRICVSRKYDTAERILLRRLRKEYVRRYR